MDKLIKSIMHSSGYNCNEIDSGRAILGLSLVTSTIRAQLYKGVDLLADGGCGGSPTIADLNFLSLLCRWLRPTNIIEVGTWIGTSTVVMARFSHDANIYTCDKRKWISDKILVDNSSIHFFNMSSDRMLCDVRDVAWPVGLCFIDANISDSDAVNICSLFKPCAVAVAIHDMDMHNGRDNMSRFKAAIPNARTFLPQGTAENDRTGFICSGELVEGLWQ